MGKSLLDVQRELRIKATYISAIENADASAFETPGFISGYVRSYAKYLGLDPDWAFQRFCDEAAFTPLHGMALGQARAQEKRKRDKTRRPADPIANPGTPFTPRGEAYLSKVQPGALGSLAVLVALIGGLGFGAWKVLEEVQRVTFAPVDQAPGVVSDLDPLQSATIASATPGGSDVRTPTAPELLDRLYRPQALDVPVMTARDGPIATLDPGSAGVFAAPAEDKLAPIAEPVTIEDATPEIQVVDAGPPEVVMIAVRPAWVRVRSAEGSVIFEKIMDPCEQFVLPQTEEPPTLRAGESGAVYFAVSGQIYGPAGRPGTVTSGVALSPDAVLANYQPADPAADRELQTIVADLGAGEGAGAASLARVCTPE